MSRKLLESDLIHLTTNLRCFTLREILSFLKEVIKREQKNKRITKWKR